jgi:hypothetical protein
MYAPIGPGDFSPARVVYEKRQRGINVDNDPPDGYDTRNFGREEEE